jgi:hypothetical protein
MIGKELFFIDKGTIKSAKVINTSKYYIIFSSKLRRRVYNVFESEIEAGRRLEFVIRTGFKFSIGINNIKELKETISLIEKHPEWLI